MDRQRYRQARVFLGEHARALEARMAETLLDDADAEPAAEALAHYRSGQGFGRGLEPDVPMEQASVLAATVALQHLRALAVDDAHPLVVAACGYLEARFDRASLSWAFLERELGDGDQGAPWWRGPERLDPSAHLDNPRPEIAGYLAERASLFGADLRQDVERAALAWLDEVDELEQHAGLCVVRWAESPGLDEALQRRVVQRGSELLDRGVSRDRQAWSQGYVLRPHQVAPHPESPFAPVVAADIEADLDVLLGQQADDGAWSPPWAWPGPGWQDAERAWRGILTVQNLVTLQAWGRINTPST